MRVKSLEIKSSWKNLEGFSIKFDEYKDITVIIGKNGSAKSNLFESIIQIFKQIERNGKSLFSYEINYSIEGEKESHDVRVTSELNSTPKATVDGKKVSHSDLKTLWTPRYLVGYYSGTSDRFEEVFRVFDKDTLDKTIYADEDEEKLEFRKFIYARPIHGLFALLAFYFSEDQKVTNFLKDFIRIEGFDSLLLTIKRPDWGRHSDKKAEDLWGAKGPVRILLDKIKKYSLAPIHLNNELVYLYIPDLQSLLSLANEYGQDPKALFQAFDTMRLSDLIEDIRIRVRVKGANGAIHLRQLSEGEQQLLTVVGLLRFTRNDNSLYILDEPDTHINPIWSIRYIDILRELGGIKFNSHTLIATHDPLIVSGLTKKEIRVLRRNSQGNIMAFQPDESPRGTGIANVLTGSLYGLESQLDNFSLRVLRRLYEISEQPPTDKRARNINRLKKLIPALDSLDVSPDPYRNIARQAFKMTQEKIIESSYEPDDKFEMAANLSEKLFREVTNPREEE